ESTAWSLAAKATLVLVVALGIARAAKTTRAAVRHAIVASLFGVLLFLPAASIIAPPITIAIATGPAVDEPAPDTLPRPTGGASSTSIAAQRPAREAADRSAGSAMSIDVLFIGIWTIGSILFLVPLVGGLLQVRR